MSRNIIARCTLMMLSLFASFVTVAQDKVEMADVMRSNGKIYVVVAVCLAILIGLFLYVMMLDRKMRKIENNKHPH